MKNQPVRKMIFHGAFFKSMLVYPGVRPFMGFVWGYFRGFHDFFMELYESDWGSSHIEFGLEDGYPFR